MRVSVHVPDHVGEAVKQRAEDEGISVSQFYARAVEQVLERRRRKEAHADVSRLIGSVDPDEYPRHRFDEVQRELRKEDVQR